MSLEQQISREEKIARAVAEIGGLLRTMPDDAAAREMMRRANELLPQAPPSFADDARSRDMIKAILREAPEGLTTPEIATRIQRDGVTAATLRMPLHRMKNRGEAKDLGRRGNMTVWGPA